MLQTSDFQIILQISVFAVVVSDMLARPKMLLEQYGRWLDKLETTRPKLAYPLGYCAKGFAGQIALWMFPVINGEYLAYEPILTLVRWISFVSCAILFFFFFSQAWALLKR